jgi:hypothetical protein
LEADPHEAEARRSVLTYFNALGSQDIHGFCLIINYLLVIDSNRCTQRYASKPKPPRNVATFYHFTKEFLSVGY